MSQGFRYERKFLVDSYHYSVLEQMIRMHPAAFRKPYPDRQVNNIYFDSPQFNAYQYNVMGISDRQKVRIRWYGDSQVQKINNPVLEIKLKSNQLGRKKSFPLDPLELSDRRTLQNTVRDVIGPSVSLLEPVLINSYLRSYYTSADGKFRLTLDRALTFSQYRKSWRKMELQLTDHSVLELKYPFQLDDEIDRIVQYIPFRQTKSSKYVIGINLLYFD